MKKDCQCEKCQDSCFRKPGWFKPGEAEKVARFLKIPFKKLFNEFLAVDWYEDYEGKDVFVLAPAIKKETTGTEYPANPLGECVFFKGGLCSIHDVKPFECRKSYSCDKILDEKNYYMRKIKLPIVRAWSKSQISIQKLLRRKPKPKKYSFFENLLWK